MKARSTALAAAMVACFAGFSPLTATADSPSPVVIQAHPCTFAPIEIGMWSATGGINDSGTYVATEGVVSPPDRPPFSPGPLRETFVLTSSGANGAFTVKAEELLKGTAPNLVQTGVWQIESGSGAYVDASGHGDVSFSVTPTPSCFGGITFTLTLAGVISKVG